MKEAINSVLEVIKEMFTIRCPDCNGTMKQEFFDMTIDKMVYKCTICGRRWC